MGRTRLIFLRRQGSQAREVFVRFTPSLLAAELAVALDGLAGTWVPCRVRTIGYKGLRPHREFLSLVHFSPIPRVDRVRGPRYRNYQSREMAEAAPSDARHGAYAHA